MISTIAPDLGGLLPFLVAFVAVAALASVASLAYLGRTAYVVVAANHRRRIARHESIPTYYRRVLLTH